MQGRELDALVAEKVMGCTVYRDSLRPTFFRCDCPGANGAGLRPHGEGFDAEIKHYSTDISAAWQVVEKMREDGWQLRLEGGLFDNTNTFVEFIRFERHESGATSLIGPGARGYAESPAKAICLAALRALGVEVPALQ